MIFLSQLSRSLSVVTFTLCCVVGALGADDLARQFADPPDTSRPWVWTHWLHGNVNREGITRDLEAIKRVGLGGVTMFDVAQAAIPPGPHAYFSPSWQELFAHQIAEAKRLGLGVMSQNGPGYSGNGGPWITPEFAAQKLVESATRVTGGRRFSGVLPQPPLNGDFYRDVAVLAIRETEAQANYRLADLDLKRLVWLNFIKWVGTRSAPLDATAPPEVCIPRDAVIDLTRPDVRRGRIGVGRSPGDVDDPAVWPHLDRSEDLARTARGPRPRVRQTRSPRYSHAFRPRHETHDRVGRPRCRTDLHVLLRR